MYSVMLCGSVLLRMIVQTDVQCDVVRLSSAENDKCCRQICREHQNTHFCSVNFSENPAVYEILGKIW
jgi:hypothetical protein